MEKWTKPELETLDINETAHKWTGVYRDGGYIEMVRYQVIYHGTNRQMIPTQMVMALQIC